MTTSLAGHLIRDAASLSRIGVPAIDVIVLSGDIAERGKRAEYADALQFVDHLCEALGLGRERVVLVPGNHDVDPQIPYAKKWRHYQNLMTELHGSAAFTEEQPYRLHQFDDLRVMVAAMNSTIKESHRGDDHWDMLRIGVLHHKARRKALADNENLRDEDRIRGHQR